MTFFLKKGVSVTFILHRIICKRELK